MNEHFFSTGGKAHWVNMHLAEVMDRQGAEKVLACMGDVMQAKNEGSVEILVGAPGDLCLYRVTITPARIAPSSPPG